MKSEYLKLLEKYKIIPTFPCSDEYFRRSGMKEVITGDFIYWKQYDWVVGTPINVNTGELLPSNGVCGDYEQWSPKIWGGLPESKIPPNYNKEFLSFEYIYDPKNFLNLSGNKWQVFRKNIRKFPGRYGNAPLLYINAEYISEHENQLKELLLEWLKKKEGDQEIHDDEVMINYMFNGNNRKVLVDKDNKILGINIWDSNYMYINFRFNFSRDIKFLNEYMRYLFYTDPVILNQNKLVNDGGSLDNKNLEAFKDKLNPIEKREIFSYIKTEGAT